MADEQMRRESRFNTPSAGLNLEAVAGRQVRKIRFISLAIAVALHGSLAVWKVSADRKAVKPLTTRFIKREPRLIKPLELRKAPKPKRRKMRRRMKRVRAKVDTRGLSRAPKASRVLDSLVRPVTTVEQTAEFERPALEPTIESGVVSLDKVPGVRLDLSLEMIDISALDTGKDRAFIIQDAEDKRRITGFFHIARAYSSTASFKARGTKLTGAEYHYGRNSNPQGLTHLAESVNEYTDIHVDVLDDLTLDDPELLKVPWTVFNTINQFDASGAELRNLGQYLTSGGFLWLDYSMAGGPPEISPDYTEVVQFKRQLLKDALETQDFRLGRHYNRVELPNDHPVYHSFYDFDGPPGGNDVGGRFRAYGIGGGLRNARDGQLRRINWYVGNDGRVMAILTDLMEKWTKDVIASGSMVHYFPDAGRRQFLEFSINVIVFALTQEGSLAQRAVAAGY